MTELSALVLNCSLKRTAAHAGTVAHRVGRCATPRPGRDSRLIVPVSR